MPHASRHAALGVVIAAFALWMESGSVARAQSAYDATYEGPTTRYAHGVLGDSVEYTTIAVRLPDGRMLRRALPEAVVFEDLSPRMVDLDGDGVPELIAVEAHQALGARLAIWRIEAMALEPLIATPWIGTRFRWLAPVGAGDLDGDGAMEIAYIDLPHLARTLRVWRIGFDAAGLATLTEIAALQGLSNHRIGQDFITGGLRDCGDGPEMLTADRDWTQVMATVLQPSGDLDTRPVARFSPEAIATALACGG